MRQNYWSVSIFAFLLLVLSGTASAASATFSGFVDDGFATLFDISLNDTSVDNKLKIGLNNFTAGLGGLGPIANDSISFTIFAPVGFLIDTITYTEGGSGATSAGGFALATGSMLIDGAPAPSFLTQFFSGNSASLWTIGTLPLAQGGKSEVAVSISNNLFAIGPGATISKTLAEVTVGLVPIPIPPAVWMFGVGLAGMAAWRKRPTQGTRPA